MITGGLSILIFENKISNVLSQIIGIGLISLYFYNFFRFSTYPLRDIFKMYCSYAYVISIIGLVLFFILLFFGLDINNLISKYLPFYGYPYNPNSSFVWLKVRGVFLEPAHFGGIILPAFAFLVYNYKENLKRVLIVGLALICTFSSITYIGMLAILLTLQKGAKFGKIAIITFIGVFFGLITYNYIEDVKIRVDDTFNVITSSDLNFEGTNLSTYAILSNLYVSGEVFKSSPIIGHGIGSHPISHKKYISDLTGIDTFEIWDLADTNSTDANSFFIRTISEIGLVGIILIFIFIKKNYSSYQSDISKSILIYFLYKLIRDGHYFPPELYFFVFMYYFLHREKIKIELPTINKNLL
jgi:hypothetical protein